MLDKSKCYNLFDKQHQARKHISYAVDNYELKHIKFTKLIAWSRLSLSKKCYVALISSR